MYVLCRQDGACHGSTFYFYNYATIECLARGCASINIYCYQGCNMFFSGQNVAIDAEIYIYNDSIIYTTVTSNQRRALGSSDIYIYSGTE